MARTIKNNLTMKGADTVDPFTPVNAYDELGRRWTIGPNQRVSFRGDHMPDTLLGNASGVQNRAVLKFVKVEDGVNSGNEIT